MRARFAAFGVVVLVLSLSPSPVHAQRGRGGAPATAAPPAPSVPHDARDVSGVWRRQRGFLGMSNQTPPMTAWGQAKFDAAKPVYGPRAVAGGLGNDPVMTCDPLGMPRNLFLEVSIYPMELVQTPRRVFQFFEWAHVWREIWTDGRALPTDPEPRWMGYSVGRWEGDEFVVNSLGFDERTWLDHFGHPISGEARFEERYRRVDRDTLELTMTLTDPKTYTRPWSNERVFTRLDSAIIEYSCEENNKSLWEGRITPWTPPWARPPSER